MEGWMEHKNIYDTIRVTKSYWPAIMSGKIFECSIGEELRAAAQEVPDKIALVDGDPDPAKRRRWTYAQLLANSEKIASALLGKFKPGEHVAIWSKNSPEWILLYYGCALAGLVVVTVNPAYKAREFEYVLKQSDAVGLFLADEYRGFNMLETAQRAKENLPKLREIVRFAEFDSFVNSGNESMNFPDVKPRDPFIIMYTSGTTGEPKGALLHHMGLLNTDYYVGLFSRLGPDDIWVAPLPLFHIATCGLAVLGCLTHRARIVIVPDPDIANILDCFDKEAGTYIQLPPVLLNAIIAFPDRTKSQLRTLRTIGGMEFKAPTVELIYKELGKQIKYWICYGQTEAHGVLTESHPDDSDEEIITTAGRPFPWQELKIINSETGEIQPLNTVGEICYRGYLNMLGYYNRPEANKQTIEPDGWQHSGDIGMMDERGFVKVTGRLKDMIRRGGENIYPREVEGLLLEHPKVQNVVVLGMPSEQWGEEVAGVVSPHSTDDMPTAQELFEFCKARLTHFKVPRLWSITTKEMPYTGAGKAQKFVIREIIQRGEIEVERV